MLRGTVVGPGDRKDHERRLPRTVCGPEVQRPFHYARGGLPCRLFPSLRYNSARPPLSFGSLSCIYSKVRERARLMLPLLAISKHAGS